MSNTPKAELVLALDFPEPAPALALAEQLRGIVTWMKVGLELYLIGGQPLIARLKNLGFRVFLDLKFMDIPNTVQGAVAQATRMGADMLTLHALGGKNMSEGALAGRDKGLTNGQTPPILLAVTVLTSMGPQDLIWKHDATDADVTSTVSLLASSVQSWKLDGVVCSGREVRAIRGTCGPDFQLLTPGIRMPNGEAGDQTRVCTPAQAVRDGSNFLVVGRPITKASDPVHMARLFLEDIK